MGTINIIITIFVILCGEHICMAHSNTSVTRCVIAHEHSVIQEIVVDPLLRLGYKEHPLKKSQEPPQIRQCSLKVEEKQFVLLSRECLSIFSETKSLFWTNTWRSIAHGIAMLRAKNFSNHVSRSLSKALLSLTALLIEILCNILYLKYLYTI